MVPDLGLGTVQTLNAQRIAEETGLRERMTEEEKTGLVVNNLKVDAMTNAVLGAGGAVVGGVRGRLQREEGDRMWRRETANIT